jgi:hypothetical protein
MQIHPPGCQSAPVWHGHLAEVHRKLAAIFPSAPSACGFIRSRVKGPMNEHAIYRRTLMIFQRRAFSPHFFIHPLHASVNKRRTPSAWLAMTVQSVMNVSSGNSTATDPRLIFPPIFSVFKFLKKKKKT